MSFASGQSEALHSMSLLAVPPIPNLKDIVKAIPDFPRQLYMSSYMLLMQSRFAEQVLSRNNAGFVEKSGVNGHLLGILLSQIFHLPARLFKIQILLGQLPAITTTYLQF